MSGTRVLRNLALIGFMGTGKSSVGRLVAQLLGFEFIDTDHLVEKQAGKSIARIFSDEGEAAFRDQERQVLQLLAERKDAVISTGGGLPAQPGNLDLLKAHSLVVCLWASPEVIWERVKDSTHRPLLQDPDPMGRIRTLLAAREPFYRQADVLINAEWRSAREVAHQVATQFQDARAANLHP